jgi:hypothetical protein
MGKRKQELEHAHAEIARLRATVADLSQVLVEKDAALRRADALYQAAFRCGEASEGSEAHTDAFHTAQSILAEMRAALQLMSSQHGTQPRAIEVPMDERLLSALREAILPMRRLIDEAGRL